MNMSTRSILKRIFLGATLAILKLAKRGAYLEIPGGPLTDWRKEEYVKVFLDGIAEIARNNKCVFVRMRPNIPDNEENRALAKKLGLVPSPMHLHAEHTVMIDLAKTEDELMSDMRRQTRYEVRKADKYKDLSPRRANSSWRSIRLSAKTLESTRQNFMIRFWQKV